MLTVNGRFLTQRITGAQRYAYEVTRRLVALRGGEDVQTFLPRHRDPVPEELASVAQPVGYLQGHFWEQLELGRWANRERGVLWSPVNVGPVNATSHVVTIHDVFSIQFPQWVGRQFHLWYSFLLPRIAASAHHIITDSKYSKVTIVEVLKVPEDKVSVVFLGVDPGFGIAERTEAERVRRKYDLPKDFLLTLGSLEPRKNLARVVDAWLRVDKKNRPPLIIAGGLGVQKVFGKYSTDTLRRHKGVQLLGYIPEEDLAGLYSAANVFVYASLLEGFGLPPLEALACGATVVTSATSAMKETSERVAFLVDPGSVESIADGIVQALQMEQTFADRENQSRYIKKRFDWRETTNQVEAILRQYE